MAATPHVKVVADPSNPLGFTADGTPFRTLPEGQSQGSLVAAMLPAGAHYVKAFGTLGVDQLATSANRAPSRAVLFYAADEVGPLQLQGGCRR